MGEEKKPAAKRKALGCVVFLLIAGVSLFSGGIYLMQGWNEAGGLARTGAIVLVIAGSLVLLPLVIVLIALAVIRIIAGKVKKAVDGLKSSVESTLAGPAKDIIAMNKAMYGTIHEFRPAVEGDFEGLDRDYYEQTTAELTGRGFRHLGDLVDKTIEESQGEHPPIRVLTAEGGTTQAALFHLAPKKVSSIMAGKSLTIREFATELSDGSFLMTSNLLGLDLITAPPKLVKERLDLATPVAEMLQRHEKRKEEYLQSRPGLTCVAINTLEEAIESEKRQQLVKNEHRKQIGYADPEEVRRIGKAGTADEDKQRVADCVANAVERETRKEQ